MRVLLFMPQAWGDEVVNLISLDGEPGTQPTEIFIVASAQDALEHIAEQNLEFVLVAGQPEYLKVEILGACDLFGMPIVALTENQDDERYAADLGLAQTCPRTDTSRILRSLWGENHPLAPRVVAEVASSVIEVEEINISPVSTPNPTESTIVSVWGPAGSPGRTTVAISLARECAQLDKRVLLIDADTYGGAISLHLGLGFDTSGITRACRLAQKDELTWDAFRGCIEVMPDSRNNLHVLTGISDPGRWPEISESKMTTILALARDWFDVIVIDVGFNLETDEEISSDLFAPRRNAATLTSLRESDAIVAVCGADSVSLARFMRMHRNLKERFFDKPIAVAVNKTYSHKNRTEVSEVLGRFASIAPTTTIPFQKSGTDMSRSLEVSTAVQTHIAPIMKDLNVSADSPDSTREKLGVLRRISSQFAH